MLELALKTLLLAAPPLISLVGIHRTKTFWPLAFFAFIGATITVINLRIAAQLSTLQNMASPSTASNSGLGYHLASWILGLLILTFGITKMLKHRREQALAELLNDEG